MRKTPAELAIERFGGVRELARQLASVDNPVHYSRVSRWTKAKDKGGCNGMIPNKYHKSILELARRQRIKFTATELIYGERD